MSTPDDRGLEETAAEDAVDETADLLCGEPDNDEGEQPAPPEADLDGDEVPDVPVDEANGVGADERSDLHFLHHAAWLADDRQRRSLIVGAPTLTPNQAMAALKTLGWRIRTTAEYKQAVGNFQLGWNLGPPLATDQVLGPLTSAALSVSLNRLRSGRPTASQRFSFTTFRCKCGGRYAACPRIWFRRTLVATLEIVSVKAYRGGLVPISACRCVSHNRAVGGSSLSQHLYGTAADIGYAVRDTTLASWRVAAGIGRSRSSHLVRHLDRRDQSRANPTHGSLAYPTVWDYSR